MSRNLIEFETRAIEDRNKTLENGHFSFKDVEFCKITQFGGRHSVDKEITQAQLETWRGNPDLRYIYDSYKAWKEGEESPVNGHPLKMWPPISPAQIKACQKLQIRAVEELAEIPDSNLSILGQGARAIRDKAREWLKISGDQGVVLQEIAAIKTQLDSLQAENIKLRDQNETLKEKLKKSKE